MSSGIIGLPAADEVAAICQQRDPAAICLSDGPQTPAEAFLSFLFAFWPEILLGTLCLAVSMWLLRFAMRKYRDWFRTI